MKHSVKPTVTGNAVAQDDCVLLPSVAVVVDSNQSVSNDEVLSRFGLIDEANTVDHDYAITADRISLSEFSSNIVVYIAGFVARRLCDKLSCVACKLSLLCSTKVVANSKLLERKDAGGLVFPSHSVVVVCRTAEQCLRFVSAANEMTHCSKLRLALQVTVIQRVQHLHLFVDTADEHTCRSDLFESRLVTLTRAVVSE